MRQEQCASSHDWKVHPHPQCDHAGSPHLVKWLLNADWRGRLCKNVAQFLALGGAGSALAPAWQLSDDHVVPVACHLRTDHGY
eukprot:1601645-Amphidinium_carterae.1